MVHARCTTCGMLITLQDTHYRCACATLARAEVQRLVAAVLVLPEGWPILDVLDLEVEPDER